MCDVLIRVTIRHHDAIRVLLYIRMVLLSSRSRSRSRSRSPVRTKVAAPAPIDPLSKLTSVTTFEEFRKQKEILKYVYMAQGHVHVMWRHRMMDDGAWGNGRHVDGV